MTAARSELNFGGGRVMDNTFEVTAASGTMRSEFDSTVSFDHGWTTGGVGVKVDFTGGHLLHLTVAGCVLNDLYREARPLGISLEGVKVTVRGEFDTDKWESRGVSYEVTLKSNATPDEVAQLLRTVDQVAEIPRAIRAGATVQRVK